MIRAVPPHAPAPSAPSRPQVEARRLLLDALVALGPARGAFVLGGGQAIEVRYGAPPFPLPPSPRCDGDLTLDPPSLGAGANPVARLRSAGLRTRGGPGHWVRADGRIAAFLRRRPRVRLDVLVPDEPWPARLGAHDPRIDGSASVMRPMVVTLLDAEERPVAALDPADARSVTARVAGPASLLLTKAHKLETRRLRAVARHRPLTSVPEKDVLDLVWVLVAADAGLERGLASLQADPRGVRVASESTGFLREHFVAPDGAFRRLAEHALAPHGALDLVARAADRAREAVDG